MSIYKKFMDWCDEKDAKKTFIEYWIKVHGPAFDGQNDNLDEYHAERAWDMMTLENKIKSLEVDLKFLKEKVSENDKHMRDNYIKKDRNSIS